MKAGYGKYKKSHGNFAVGLAGTIDTFIDVKNKRVKKR
jgi:hypothetical protein